MKRLRNSVVKWSVVALVCLLLGFLLGKFKQDVLSEQLAVLTDNLQLLETSNHNLATKFARLEVNVDSDKQTIKSLLDNNKQLQDELASANNKLFFYERVISPELEAAGVKVHSLEMFINSETQQWNFQLVLTQSQKDRRVLNGKFDIVLSVFEGDELKQVSLKDLTELTSNSFKFKYFQTIEGAFSLPPTMTVDEVIVHVNVDGNRWYKAQNIEERYDWRILTATDESNLSEFDSVENSDGAPQHIDTQVENEESSQSSNESNAAKEDVATNQRASGEAGDGVRDAILSVEGE